MNPEAIKNINALLSRLNKISVIAIDGRAGAGKSTLAAEFFKYTGAGIICMDDFFLPSELRTPERFAQPGGNIHHERFTEEVLPFLRSEEGFSYRIFDCKKMDYNGVRLVAPSKLRVVEGAYAHHPVLGEYADMRIFYDIDPVTQRQRLEKRVGSQAAALFIEKWIPLEEAYIQAYKIKERADTQF
jgi:uridine kinase